MSICLSFMSDHGETMAGFWEYTPTMISGILQSELCYPKTEIHQYYFVLIDNLYIYLPGQNF